MFEKKYGLSRSNFALPSEPFDGTNFALTANSATVTDRFHWNDAAQLAVTIGGAICCSGGCFAHVIHQIQSAALASRGVRAIRRRHLNVRFGEVRRRTLQLYTNMFRYIIEQIQSIQIL